MMISNTAEKLCRFVKTIRHSMVVAEVCLSIMTTYYF